MSIIRSMGLAAGQDSEPRPVIAPNADVGVRDESAALRVLELTQTAVMHVPAYANGAVDLDKRPAGRSTGRSGTGCRYVM